jgi:hypothetical protein
MLESHPVIRRASAVVEERVEHLKRELPVSDSLVEDRLGSANDLVRNVCSTLARSCRVHVRHRPLAVWGCHASSAVPFDRIRTVRDIAPE